MYCFYEYNFRLWGVRGLNVPSSSVDPCANCKTQYFGQLYIMYDSKLHDVNILDQLLPEIGAFYIMDRAYLDFSRSTVCIRTRSPYPQTTRYRLCQSWVGGCCRRFSLCLLNQCYS